MLKCDAQKQELLGMNKRVKMNALKSAEPSAWIFMALNYYNAHARFLQKNGRQYGHSTEAVLDLRNGAFSEKSPQIF